MGDVRTLSLEVRFHEGRYHGVPEWPPAPGRLFQALVAGAGPSLSGRGERALRWLEALRPPVVGAPLAIEGERVHLYVPNNDLDAHGGDPAEVAGIRTTKWVQPHLFDATIPLLYLWRFDPSDEELAIEVCRLADGLYQLGRGVDMAWARASLLEPDTAQSRLRDYPGRVHHPTPAGREGTLLPCPIRGTYDSLVARFDASGRRFEVEGMGKQAIQVFVQPPKPRFAEIAYDSLAARRLFELRPSGNIDRFAVCPLAGVSPFVVRLRDAAAERLRSALPAIADDIERAIVGRAAGGTEPRKEHRIRIVALPSIGHPHADRGARRVLVEVPPGGPLAPDDVFWAFSGLEVEVAPGVPAILQPSDDLEMAERYGVGAPARRWQTVTAAALPETVARRRIDPDRRSEEAKGGPERDREEARAATAVLQALRHLALGARPLAVRVRREPFDNRGARAEAFAPGTRFPKERLWHVEITFDRALGGPMVLGDGRFVGLGVMQPSPEVPRHFAWRVVGGLERQVHAEEVAGHLRRAVLARAQAEWGARARLPPWITGHREDGAPAEGHAHLSYLVDPLRQRLLVIAPRHRDPRLGSALEGLTDLRAGRAGRLTLQAVSLDERDPLLAPSRTWRTVTPYRVNRHLRRGSPSAAVEDDVRAACRDQGLPEPAEIRIGSTTTVPGVGLEASVEIGFAVAVAGPLALGRTRHRGGGLFENGPGPK